MPTPRLSREKAQQAVEAVNAALRAGYRKGGKPSIYMVAAESIGTNSRTLQSRLDAAREQYALTPDWPVEEAAPAEIDPAPPVEVHDSAFWRKRASAAERQIGELQRVIGELGGVSGIRQVPDWRPSSGGRRGRSVVAAHLSDVHYGEIIRANEIDGINEFNPTICERRLKRFGEAVCVMGRRWAEDTDCKGVLLTCNGDLVSGDIHEELRETNAMTSLDQAHEVARLISALLSMLLETYGTAHVIGTPGNHGRTTRKPTAKRYAELSYDILAMKLVRDRFENDGRVTFQFGATDQITPIFSETIFTSHGDKLGSAGGKGFVGPMLSIIRGSEKVIRQHANIGHRLTIMQTGHFHTTGNPRLGQTTVFANGSVPGYSEFGRDIRAAVEPPQQWAYLIHDRWGVRERAEVRLEEPAPAAKPKVRVPAGMAA